MSATTAGQDPEDTPSKWELQELPEALSVSLSLVSEAGDKFALGKPESFDLGQPVRRVVTLDQTSGQKLLVILGEGEKAAVYKFDGSKAPVAIFNLQATNDLFTCAAAVGDGFVIFSQSSSGKFSTKYQIYDASGESYVAGRFGGLASLADNDNITIPEIHSRIVAKQTVKTEEQMKLYANTIPGTRVAYVMVPIKGGEFVMGSPSAGVALAGGAFLFVFSLFLMWRFPYADRRRQLGYGAVAILVLVLAFGFSTQWSVIAMGGKDALAIHMQRVFDQADDLALGQLRQAAIEANLAPQLDSLAQQYENLASRETRGAFSGLRGEGSVVATLRNMSQLFGNLSRTVRSVDADQRARYARYKELTAAARKVAAETEAADVSESEKIRRNNLAFSRILGEINEQDTIRVGRRQKEARESIPAGFRLFLSACRVSRCDARPGGPGEAPSRTGSAPR